MKIYKIKISLIILIISFSLNNLKAQAYVPMLNNYAEWHVTNCFSGCATDKYYTVGDTLIGSYHYQFLDLFHYNKNFVIREDTAARKIYLKLLADPPPAKDYLLYDFSLAVNDTISITNPGSPYPKYPGEFILDSIKTKLLVNTNHRFFYLHSLDTLTSTTKNTIWIEGIGSLCLINTPGAMPQINGAGQLSCFFNNGTIEYSNLDSIADCATIYPLGVKNNSKETSYILTQNSELNTLTLLSKHNDIHQYMIYNIDGKLLLEKNGIKTKSIQISTELFPENMLLLKITNSAGENYNFKIINY